MLEFWSADLNPDVLSLKAQLTEHLIKWLVEDAKQKEYAP